LEWDQSEERSAVLPHEPHNSAITVERFMFVGFLAALLLIAFILGAIFTTAQVFPGTFVAQAYQGGIALYDQVTSYDDVYKTDLWYPARKGERGVSIHASGRPLEGVTLFTAGDGAVVRLIDMDGRVLHEWRKPFSEVWTAEKSPIRDPQPDSHVYFRKAHLFPNGDLLAIYEGVGDSPYGYGMVKLDWDSKVLWTYFGRTHHSFDVGEDGRIYVLTHEISEEEIPSFGHLAPPRMDDQLAVLSPEGEELQRIDLIKAVANSPYAPLLHTVSFYSVHDPLHSNDVEVINAKEASKLPFAEEGQILLSFRELNALAVLDPKTETLVWVTRGSWIGQHDPDITEEGHILLFDNYGRFDSPTGSSRVIEFDPMTQEIIWQFPGKTGQPLQSAIRADQQRLVNGDTLITESSGGRILEVTREGEIVWEYVHPLRGGKNNDLIPIICFAERIDPSTLDPGLLLPGSLTKPLS
jgi:Arylsulfotransferase (ASST)